MALWSYCQCWEHEHARIENGGVFNKFLSLKILLLNPERTSVFVLSWTRFHLKQLQHSENVQQAVDSTFTVWLLELQAPTKRSSSTCWNAAILAHWYVWLKKVLVTLREDHVHEKRLFGYGVLLSVLPCTLFFEINYKLGPFVTWLSAIPLSAPG